MKLLLGSLALLAMMFPGCPLPEMGGEGQPCFESEDPCDQGLVCRPFDSLCIYPECTPADPTCPAGEYCDFNEFACKAGSVGCQNDGDCPVGHFCDPVQQVCKPETGDQGALGDPCTFNSSGNPTLHPDAPPCSDGLDCIGYPPTGDFGICGMSHDCWMLNLQSNADCVEGRCGGSQCMSRCDPGCPPGFWEVDVGGQCYCGREIEDRFCNPVANTGCLGGEKCRVVNLDPGVITVCSPTGTLGPGAPCDWNDPGRLCDPGFQCLEIEGAKNCWELCDTRSDHCTGESCLPWPDSFWGICPSTAK